MGLGLHAVDAIGREHAYRPIKGDVLFIGRQATYFTPSGLAAQLRSHGHAVDTSAIEVDRTTIHHLPGYGEIVTDRSIFHALGINSVKALDASAYEGAEIVHDLNRPLPDNLKATADFIVDGSTLDNVFDPAMTLRNYAQLLRPGGRLLAINTLNNRQCAFTICSPDWFLDYFVENGFSDCKVYVCAGFAGAFNSYWLDTEYMASQRPGKLVFPPMLWDYYTLVFAERGPLPPRNALPCSIPIVRRTSGHAMKCNFPQSIVPHDRIWRVRWECCCRACRGAVSSGWTRHSSHGHCGRPCRVRSCAPECTRRNRTDR